MSASGRFSPVGMACVLLCGLMLAAALLPAASRAREAENRVLCAKNLHSIGQAIAFYCNNETRNGQSFPRTTFNLDKADHPRLFTGARQPHSFGADGPEANDVTAAFYLLFKVEDTEPLQPQTLVCPGSDRKVLSFADEQPKPAAPLAASKGAWSNFPGMEYVSYSIQNMYPSKEALGEGWRWNAAVNQNFVVAADLNPGGKAVSTVKANAPAAALAQANSPNHARAGQNVLYGDLRVEWQATPFCGEELTDGTRDNIYSRRAGVAGDPIMGPAMDRLDSILLPAADYKPDAK